MLGKETDLAGTLAKMLFDDKIAVSVLSAQRGSDPGATCKIPPANIRKTEISGDVDRRVSPASESRVLKWKADFGSQVAKWSWTALP